MARAQNKRIRKPGCPRCKHPGYWLGKALDGRPSFTCDKCGHYWTAGKDGREFGPYALTPKD